MDHEFTRWTAGCGFGRPMPPKNCCHCWQPEDAHGPGTPPIMWILKTGLTDVMSGYGPLDSLGSYEALQLNQLGQETFVGPGGSLPNGWEALSEAKADDGFVWTQVSPYTYSSWLSHETCRDHSPLGGMHRTYRR